MVDVTERLKDEQFMNKKQEEDDARKEERSNVGDYIDTSWYWS
jgi:hypothetical protein